MIAAIYARKSTEQNGVSDEQKSVTRQVEHARQSAERQGWTVADDHVYTDDGISGAEFERRPGYVALMAACSRKRGRAPFQALIVSDLDRLGREPMALGYTFREFLRAGVRVFSYLQGKEIALNDATAVFMMQAQAFAASMEREKARQRTYDALVRKARAGHVTGGRVFGYDNVEIAGHNGKRSHVERRINAAEAVIVREIFERYAAGEGMRRIAHSLNARQVPSPRAQQGRRSGWQIGTLRAVLQRLLYRGVIAWNRTQKRNTLGEKQQHAKAQTEWIELPAPDLRIVDDALWATAQRKRQERTIRTRSGQVKGKGARIPKYLLSGLLTCSCGGRYEAVKRYPHGLVYMCATNRRKGAAVCPNGEIVPVATMDRAVIDALEQHSLTDTFVEYVLDTLDAPPDSARIEAEIAKADQELRNLIELAKAAGQSIPHLADEMGRANGRLAEFRGQLAALPERPDRDQLRLALARRVADWRDILHRHTEQARLVVSQLTGGKLTTLKQGGKPFWLIELEAPGLLDGLVYQCGSSPTGFEPVFQP